MKIKLRKMGTLSVMALALACSNTALAKDEVDFAASLLFDDSPGVGFSAFGGPISQSTLGPLVSSGSVVLGGFGGNFSVGPQTTTGSVSEAPLTGSTSIQISDFTFAGTLDGTLSLTEIQETPGASGYNDTVFGTVTGLSLAGSDPGLLTLEGQGTLSVTLTLLNSSMDLSSLMSAASSTTVGLNNFQGAINGAMVPDATATWALLGGAGTALGWLRRPRKLRPC